jgi:hypothetical protein
VYLHGLVDLNEFIQPQFFLQLASLLLQATEQVSIVIVVIAKYRLLIAVMPGIWNRNEFIVTYKKKRLKSNSGMSIVVPWTLN